MQLIYTDAEKKRLDKFLHETYPDISRAQIQKFIKNNAIIVEGKRSTVHHWLKSGDRIEGPDLTIEKSKTKSTELQVKPVVIYHDQDIAVLLKPAGLLIHPTDQNETNTLATWLKAEFPEIHSVGDDPSRPGIVHRLDKDVAGLVVVARTQASYDHLKDLFHNHDIVKKYQSLVHGDVKQDEGAIDTPIERDRKKGRMVAQSGTGEGKEALTTYRVLERYKNYTLLDIQILTGRTHQIRTHLFSIGHAIVGDRLYQTRDIKKRKGKQLLDRPFLFAYYLSFIDLDGHRKEFTVDLPSVLQNIIIKLKK